MIAIVDYGLGNIRAFANVYKELDMPFLIASKPEELKSAAKIILPGVGVFDEAMQLLQKSGLRETLDELVLQRKLPVLGICVGMQILAHSSEEGKLPGLGWIDGEVKKIDTSSMKQATRLPHIGWNDVKPIVKNRLFNGLDLEARFYFLHSYYFQCRKNDEVIAITDYGDPFASAVNSGNIYGVQFHPEKSHENGIRLLENFGKWG